MNDYLTEMRRLVGTRPLVGCSAGVILLDREHRVLLQRRTDNGCWAIPGGATELAERVEDTAIRETQEEVGLTCHRLELFGVYSGPRLYYRYPNGDEVHIVAVIYLCRDFSGELCVDATESKEAAFFPIDALPSPLNPPDLPLLEDVQRRQAEIVRE